MLNRKPMISEKRTLRFEWINLDSNQGNTHYEWVALGRYAIDPCVQYLLFMKV